MSQRSPPCVYQFYWRRTIARPYTQLDYCKRAPSLVAHGNSEPHHVSRARPRVTSPPLRHSTLQPRILESPYQLGCPSPLPCAPSLDDWHLKDPNTLGKIFVIVFRRTLYLSRAPTEHGSPTRPASSLRPTLRKCTSPPSCRCLMPTRIQIDVRSGTLSNHQNWRLNTLHKSQIATHAIPCTTAMPNHASACS